jgi:replicative DNA helicase
MEKNILKTLLTSPTLYERLKLNDIINEFHFTDFLEIAKIIFDGLETKKFVNQTTLLKTLPKKHHTDVDSILKCKVLSNENDLLDSVYVVRERILKDSFTDLLNESAKDLNDSTDVINVLDDLEKKIINLKSDVFRNNRANQYDLYKDTVQKRRTDGVAFYATGYGIDVDMPYVEGDLNAICGRYGMGKTSFAISMAKGVNEQGFKSCFISAEMIVARLIDRAISYETGIPTKLLTTDRLDASQRRLQDASLIKLKKLNVLFEYESNFLSVCRLIIDFALNKGVKVVFIDYLQLLTFKSSGNQSADFGDLSKRLKQLSNTLGITINALIQLKRPQHGQIKRPLTIDIASSDEIARNCDNIILLHRPSYYFDADDLEVASKEDIEKTEVLIGKSRDGETGLFEMKFVKGQFFDIDTNDNIDSETFAPTKAYNGAIPTDRQNSNDDIPF